MSAGGPDEPDAQGPTDRGQAAAGTEDTLAPSDPGLDQTAAQRGAGTASERRPPATRVGSADVASARTVSVGEAATLAGSAGGPGGEPGDAGHLRPGTVLGRYHILGRLGAGGMGVVYKAYDPELDRRVALKLVRVEGSAGSGAGGQGRERLLREAQAMAKLSHPNVIPVYDVGALGDQVFVAMEFVEGESLAAWMATRRPWQETLQVFRAAGQGLAAAHEAGLIHRDFKPDNVLVGKDGRVRVLDFGLARAGGHAEGGAGEREERPARDKGAGLAGSSGRLSAPLTMAGSIMGTPAYMSPEQHTGLPTDPRTDQFSFCVALYEGLYGARPFGGATYDELRANVLAGKVREAPQAKPGEARVPVWIRPILLRGLAADPAARFGSMVELLAALGHDPARARRRAGLVIGAVLLAGGAAGTALLLSPDPPPPVVIAPAAPVPCQGARAQLAGVWDDGTKAKGKQAFLASGSPLANDAWPRVEARLDAYAEGWVKASTEACEATRLHGTQSDELLDLRMLCLDERRQELGALVLAFTAADRTLVQRAVQGVVSLAPVDDCADVASLTARVRPPADPAARAQVAAVRKVLADAKALQIAGKYKEGLAAVDAIRPTAAALGYAPLLAELVFRQGILAGRAGDPTATERLLEEALEVGERAGYDEIRAKAAGELVMTVGYQLTRPAEGHAWARRAEAILARLGPDDVLAGYLLVNEAAVYYVEANYPQASALYEKALALWEKSDDGALEVGQALANLALVRTDAGRPEQALPLLVRALVIFERELGPQHPETGGIHNNIGGALYELDRKAEAKVAFERALAVAQASNGADHPTVAEALVNLGILEAEAGRYEEALALYERALRTQTAAFGEESLQVAMVLRSVAISQLNLKRFALARETIGRSLAIRTKLLGAEHPQVASALVTLGEIASDERKYAEALRHHGAALAIRTKALGEKDLSVGKSHQVLALVYLKMRRYPDALGQAGAAVGVFEHLGDPGALAGGLTVLGEIHLQRKAARLAVAPLERAAVLRADPKLPPGDRAETAFGLARALWDSGGDKARARALAASAEEGYEAAGEAYGKERAQVVAWREAHR